MIHAGVYSMDALLFEHYSLDLKFKAVLNFNFEGCETNS